MVFGSASYRCLVVVSCVLLC